MRTIAAIIPALFALAGAALGGCFGTEVPPQTPEKNPLTDTPQPKATVDATKVEERPSDRKPPFDKEQVGRVVMRASRVAGECAKIHTTGPFGEITVQLTLSSAKGKIADAQLPTSYDGTDIGKCVEKAFESEIIPNWDGADQHMEAKVTLKKPEGDEPKDPKAKDPKGKGK